MVVALVARITDPPELVPVPPARVRLPPVLVVPVASGPFIVCAGAVAELVAVSWPSCRVAAAPPRLIHVSSVPPFVELVQATALSDDILTDAGPPLPVVSPKIFSFTPPALV